MDVLIIFALIAIAFFGLLIGGIIFLFIYLSNSKSKQKSDNTINDDSHKTSSAESINKNGMNCIRFDASKNGLFTASRQQSMLDSTESKALNWINNTHDIEIISITSTIGQMNASTTIWYKYKKSDEPASPN